MAATTKSHSTTDHDEIRRWAESRNALPACVEGTAGPFDVGILRLAFPGYSGEEPLQHISWEDWFYKFDQQGLAFVCHDHNAELN